VVPKLGQDKPGGFIAPSPTGPPVVVPTTGPHPGWNSFEDAHFLWRISYPPDWHTAEFEGHWEFIPPGLEGTTPGAEKTFAVNVLTDSYDLLVQDDPARVQGMLPNGREFYRLKENLEGVRQTFYWIDWTQKACGIEPSDCQGVSERLVLQVNVLGGDTPALFGAHEAEGEEMVLTIERIDGLTEDPVTDVLRSFLDARSKGAGAEDFLSAKAKTAYEGGAEGLKLYFQVLQGQSILYVYRQTLDEHTVRFTVSVPDEGASRLEVVDIGPGTTWSGEDKDDVVLNVIPR